MSSTLVGMIEALTGAIGEADAEIGGLFQTRLTSAIPTGTALAAVLTWNGSTTVTLADTSELTAGDWVRLDSDGQYFQIDTLVANTSLKILNPTALPIPTGATASSKASTCFPVETTLDWDAEGIVGIEGVRYHYTSKTDTTFEGVYFLAGGEVVPGPAKLLRVQSTVIDLNRSRSGMDLVRRAMLVAYAEGDDLNALARNLGVLRLPFISGDTQFRSILQALAYNPKGTVFGLELALTGLVGAGNFEIYEDLIRYPCTVFIRLLGTATTALLSQGKTYLSGPEIVDATDTAAIPIAYPIKDRGQVHNIYWAPEDRVTDCRDALPSEDTLAEYPGAGLTPAWEYQGDGTEAGQISQVAGECIAMTGDVTHTETRYHRHVRAGTYGSIRLEAVIKKVSGSTDALIHSALTIADGVRGMSAVIYAYSNNLLHIGLVDAVTGAFTAPTTYASASRTSYHTVSLEKFQNKEWRLYVDDRLVETKAYATGVSTAWTRSLFGLSGVGAGTVVPLQVKSVSIWAQDATDFASARGSAGVLANPDSFATGGYLFCADDEGKTLLIENSTVSNAAGGNNNGRWEIQPGATGLATCAVDGPANTNAEVPGATATRLSIPVIGPQFHFPDDLGRTITITGSTLANNGTWVIDKLLDPDDPSIDLDSWATKIPMQTNLCEVTGASLVPETGLGWQLHPDFTAETAVAWQLPGSIDVTGQSIALRDTFPTLDAGMLRVLAVTYSQALSAGLLPDKDTSNEVVQTVPDLLFGYYPFYLADPLGFVRTYLDEVTAAGVIPDFQITP